MKPTFHLPALALALCLAPSLHAQPLPDPLHAAIAERDAALFDAVNSRDIDKLKTMFTLDLEFYHDQGGLMNYEQNIAASRQNFASGRKIRRDLVAGSMRVYPVPRYGAMQTGEHRFCDLAREPGDCRVYKFLHVWKLTPEGYKLARVASYDH